MALKLLTRSGLVAALVLLLAHPSDLSSCGPFFPQAVFTGVHGPDEDEAFYRGQLGILQPTYQRRYLTLAYRMLSGEPLSQEQSDSLVRFASRGEQDVDLDQAVEEWLAARARIPGVTPIKIDPSRQTSVFVTFSNCGADAFQTARRTLLDLIKQSSPGSPEVHDWISAQDQVFDNCPGGAPRIPDPVPSTASESLRAQRAYQIAAAKFYSAQYNDARVDLRQIAGDHSSPWHTLAPYLVARCYLREDAFAEAQKQLNAILADPKESQIHRQTRLLLDYALARLDPPGQLVNLSKRIMQPRVADLPHDVSDYTFVFDHLQSPNFDWQAAGPGGDQKYQALLTQNIAALQRAGEKDDLTEWILTFQQVWAPAHFDYLARWHSTNSLAWLIAALCNTPGKQPEASSLVEAARAIPADSPAYATARFEAALLLIEAGREDEAARLTDEALAEYRVHYFDFSTLNAFRGARMKVAKTFAEFLRYAPRMQAREATLESQPDASVVPESNAGSLSMFDFDATSIFNHSLPLDYWLRAVRDPRLPKILRTELAQSGWLRAFLLDRQSQAFARELIGLKTSYAADLRPYLAAEDPSARKFEASFFILHHPELQPAIRPGLQRSTGDGKIDDFRDNWWAPQRQSFEPSQYEDILTQLYPGTAIPVADFLSSEQRTEAGQENEALNADGAPSLLAASVMRWVQTHPSDPRNAEALALAVKASHFAPPGPDATNAVRDAFRLLHSRYSNSDWARRTPYWYR